VEAPAPTLQPPTLWAEIARLLSSQRLALGAAHAMNNAFTAILGEAGYLRDAHKGDPELLESCGVIHAEVSRCARMTRGLLALGRGAGANDAAPDLVRLARGLASLLSESLGRRATLEVEAPDELIPVRGPSRLLEPLLVLLVHHALEQAPGVQRITVSIAPPLEGRVALAVTARRAAAEAAAEPVAAGGSELLCQALGAVAGELGSALEVGATPEGEPCWRLRLAAGG